MVKYEDALTNEQLNGLADSQFDLVNRAIRIAEYLIKSGKEARWPGNIAFEVLKKIAEEGPDQLEREVFSEGE
jgi:hypothetical protein